MTLRRTLAITAGIVLALTGLLLVIGWVRGPEARAAAFGAIVSFSMLTATTRLSVPYVLAALGGTSSERAGVVNIALEGVLVTGAFASAAVTHWTGSPWVGMAAAVPAGVLIAYVHALATVTFKADQIISGLAVNLLALGATKFGAKLVWGKPHSDNIAKLPTIWERDPDAGGLATFVHTLLAEPMVLLTILLVAAAWLLHTRTVLGLRLRAVGENAHAVDTLGLPVGGLRYTGVLMSGGFAALGGAWLAFDVTQFSSGMSAGKGYIAMAAVVFGKWHPLGATAACLLFGASEAFQLRLQAASVQVPSELVGTLPYLLTIVALVGLVGRARPPASLGVAYEKAGA